MSAGRIGGALCAVLLAASAPPLAAQESVFNLPGFGLPGSSESVRAQALGGAGIALPGNIFTLDSPASHARFDRAGLYLSLLGQQTRVEDETRSGEFDDVVFPMGQAIVPAGDAAISVGYHQFVDFDARLDSSVIFEGDTFPAALDSDGGISVLSPAVSYAFDPATALGVSLDIYGGSREDVRAVETVDLDGNSVTTADTLARNFDGIGLTVGVERRLGEDILLGAAWKLRPSMTSEITNSAADRLDGQAVEIDLPSEIVVGASAGLGRRLTAAGVVRYSGWGGFERPAEGEDLADAIEIGGGIEFAPASPVLYLLGPDAPLRAGVRWRRLPVQVGGEAVREWGASLGYGRSFGARSRVDVVLEYGRRGDIDTHGLAERFLRLGVGVGVFEQWTWGDSGGGSP